MTVRGLSVLILVLTAASCAGSPYYGKEQKTLRSAGVLECPNGSVSVCTERGGELVNCRCERVDQLGTIY